MVRAATSGLSWDSQQHQFMFDPYFVLAIDRQYLLQQTLQKVAAATPQDLRKSLKVVFKGEEGIDAGGVTKEFFQLLSSALFDGQTGMWSSQLDSNVTWFNSDCSWNYEGYHLVGVLVGLAVYNSVMLDVHFPTTVYRKLLGLSLGLEDMVDEYVRSGLHQLLEYDGDDVEDVFCLNFEVTWMDLGNERRVELKPNGGDIAVTSDNKEEYVLLYVKWRLVDSVQKQYEQFEKGVMQVLDSSSLDLLRPEEFELLVVGTPELDFSALETNTEYEGGYNTESAVVKNFWRFAKNASPESELKLLKFVTGNSMAPIGGLGTLPFKIQRASSDSMQLPTSHTCFNTLLLPDYGDNYAKLERLIGRAIIECEGFGLQ
jgi:ubiquitin-protein ligase E3 A